MAFDSTRVIAGRDFKVYSAPWTSTTALPADTVTYTTGFSSPWIDRGYTTGGLRFSMGLTYSDIRVDQSLDPITQIATARNLTMSTSLAEISAANINAATGMGTVTSTAAGSGTRGFDLLTVGDTVVRQFNSWAFDILAPDGESFRVAIWKGKSSGNPQISVSDNAASGIALDITATPDTGASPTRVMTIRDISAALP